MHRHLRTPRRRPLEGITFGVERLGAGVGDRDLDLLPFDGAAATRVRAPRVAVIAPVLQATAAAVYS